MSKERASLIVLILIFFTLSVAGNSVHLKGNSFTLEESRATAFSTQSLSEGPKILQFRQSVDKEYRNQLEEEGTEFHDYIPENAWIVTTELSRSQIIRKQKVRYIGDYTPRMKLMTESDDREKSIYRVETFDSQTGALSEKAEIEKIGENLWRVNTTGSDLSDIAEIDNVKMITDKAPEIETKNDDSRDLIDVERLQQQPFDLTGKGFTAGVWDGGLAIDHEDLTYDLSWAETQKTVIGDPDETVNDHATHVSGTMAGGGILQNQYRGMAPDSRVVSYKWPDNNSETVWETEDAVESYSAVLSQNSWGYLTDSNCDIMGDYNYMTMAYDAIISGETSSPPTSIIFSAGNERNGGCSSTYNTTTGPGATAKNTITVGAVDDTGDMTAYSSWGPTDDGRIKPDVVADGGCGDDSPVTSTLPGDNYGDKCGTSMSSPAVSGGVILLNERFNDAYGRKPEPDTVKGMVIQTSEDMGRKGPDYEYGWGLTNFTDAVEYVREDYRKDLIYNGTLESGETDNYSVKFAEGESANITVVWSDPPASYTAEKTLVNDLDLKVENNGERYYPWTLNWSSRDQQASRSKEDHKNNVEQVYISSTQEKTVNISVDSHSITEGPQRYKVLVSSNKGDGVPPETDLKSPENKTYSATPEIRFESGEKLQSASFTLNSGENHSFQNTSSEEFFNNSIELDSGRYDLTVYAEDFDGDLEKKNTSFTVDKQPPALSVFSPIQNQNLTEEINFSAYWEDELSDTSSATYLVFNSSSNLLQGDLNNTESTQSLETGEYTVNLSVQDSVGNQQIKQRDIVVDREEPEITLVDFEGNISGSTEIEAISNDNRKIKNSYYNLTNYSEVQRSFRSYNSSFESTVVEEGFYNLTFFAEDYAGNSVEKREKLNVDNTAPEINVFEPESYVNSDFNISADLSDSSGIALQSFNISNSTWSRNGTLNSSFRISNFEEGEYNITYKAEDVAGNTENITQNITVDTVKPSLSIYSPSEDQITEGEVEVNASFSDEGSGVIESNYSLKNSSGTLAEEELNGTVQTGNYRDGKYNIEFDVTDRAGNNITRERQFEIDNGGPTLVSSTVSDGDNLSETVNLNVTLFDSQGVDYSSFRLYNSSGNQTSEIELNSTVRTDNFSDGDYRIEVFSNDSLGEESRRNISVTFDNSYPELNVTEFGKEEQNGWIKNSSKVEASCNEEQTGVDYLELSYSENTSKTSANPVNFTVDSSGNYTVECVDYAGNVDSEDLELRYDSSAPEIADIQPENSSVTGREPSFSLNLDENVGLNRSRSEIRISGDTTDVAYSGDSLSFESEELDYSEDYTVEAYLVDRFNYSSTYILQYSVEEEEEETSGGGGGGGGGGGSFGASAVETEEEDTENQSEQTENQTEEVNSSRQQVNQTEDDQDGSCETVYVIRDDQCVQMDECNVDEEVETVDSCTEWERQRTQQILDNLSNRNLDEELYQEARSSFEQGDYEEARRKARESTKVERTDEGGSKAVLIGALTVGTILIVSGALLFRVYRRKRLESKVVSLSREVAAKNRDELDHERVEKIVEATDALHQQDFRKVREILSDLEKL